MFFYVPGYTRGATLQKLNLESSPGETIALVGSNGAGKSTHIHLIARLYDAGEGAVLIDDVGLRNRSSDWYYDQIAYVDQVPVRFEVPAAENIAFGDWQRLNGDRSKIESIAAEAGIDSITDQIAFGD